MLQPADAALVRRDSTVSGLGTLLDPDAFLAALGPFLEPPRPRRAELLQLRYQPARGCVALYRLHDHGNGKSFDVYAKAGGRNSNGEPSVPREPRRPHEGGHERILLRGPGILVCRFPDDLKLRSLGRLLDPKRRQRLLCRELPDRSDLWECDAVTLRYKPEQRWVCRLDAADGPSAALKLYSRTEFRALQSPTALRSRGPLRLARRLAVSGRHRLLAFEWLRGRLLRQALEAGEPGVALAPVGAALAALHGQDADGLPRRSRMDEIALLRSRARDLGFLVPQLALRADRLVGRLAARLAPQPAAEGPIHGDFYDKQVVLDGDEVAILDLDRASRGSPGADLGLFAAHLERDVLLDRLDEGRAREICGSLLEGYQVAAERPVEDLALYTAVGLLEFVTYPFRRRHRCWPAVIEELLGRAENALRRAG